jgi:nucleoside-diphosphate-sugar epimerase
MKILVMGGTRFMGVKVVELLLEHEHEVAVFNRGSRNLSWSRPVETIVGDRGDTTAMRALSGERFDGIVDLSAYTGAQTSGLLDVQGDVQRLVHISSGVVYEPQATLPWAEDTPFGPWSLWGEYASEKLACELILSERRVAASNATTVLRFPWVLGPHNYAPREEFVLNRLLDDAVVLVPGDGKAVQQFVSVDQVAHSIVACVEGFSEGGLRAFNIASHEFASLEGFIEIAARVASVDVKMLAVGGGAVGIDQLVFHAYDCVFPFPNENYVLDVTSAHTAGVAPPYVSLESMIADALDALRDDSVARRWQRTSAETEALERTT